MTDTAPPSGAPWAQAPSAVQPLGRIGQPTSPGTQILLTIVTLGVWACVWTYRQHRDIQEYSGEGVGGGLGLVIYLFVGFVTPFLLANEIETKLYGKAGQPSPVSTATGAWIFLPFAGAIVWYLKVQRALNGFWMERGATL
ncbi:MAG: DUF4234 domain-containing protein [Actinomycetota bacterium]|nr:DUF4234 domain-containing protein [Actinomycetota bacterium]